MATYKITAEFSLTTEIEPEVRSLPFDWDFDDHSYWGSASVDSTGGEITFEVEAEDEDEAERKAGEIAYDGMEAEDDNGITWLVEDVRFQVEAVEVPMDKARAVSVIETYLAQRLDSGLITEEQKEAFEFMLAYVAGMTT